MITEQNDEKKIDSPGLSGDFSGKKLVFVRHGKSVWNLNLRYQGRTDIELCQEGLDGVVRVACRLASFPVQVIITSPLKRASETAKIIAAEHKGVPIEREPLLIEADFGKLEGRTVKEIKELYGETVYKGWKRNLLDSSLLGGESEDEIISRHEKFVRNLLKRKEEYIVLVGHGAEARALFITLLGEKPSSIFWKCAIENCSISTFLQKGDRFSLYTLNDTLHQKVPKNLIAQIPIF